VKKELNFNSEVMRNAEKLYINLGPEETAYIQYEVIGGSLYILRTFVPDEFRGKGIARKLIEAAVDYAKTYSLKIVPICNYAKAYFEKNSRYNSILRTS
jgi:predicted GNAT family acetyltransferase